MAKYSFEKTRSAIGWKKQPKTLGGDSGIDRVHHNRMGSSKVLVWMLIRCYFLSTKFSVHDKERIVTLRLRSRSWDKFIGHDKELLFYIYSVALGIN